MYDDVRDRLFLAAEVDERSVALYDDSAVGRNPDWNFSVLSRELDDARRESTDVEAAPTLASEANEIVRCAERDKLRKRPIPDASSFARLQDRELARYVSDSPKPEPSEKAEFSGRDGARIEFFE